METLLILLLFLSSNASASGMSIARSLKHTPASVLKPWEIIMHDPNPPPSIEELEQSQSLEEDIESDLDKVIGTKGGVIIQRFRPTSSWLRRQWFGTVFFHTSTTALRHMFMTLFFCAGMRYISQGDIKIWLPRDTSIAFPRLEAVDKIWRTLMSLTTFLLTYFVTQAYSFWRDVLNKGRGIQGRLNDIGLLLATNGARSEKRGTTDGTTYTDEALVFLEDQATKLRVMHFLFWAANTRRFRVFLTKPGLQRLVQVGYIPPKLYQEVIANSNLPPTQKWVSLMEAALQDCQTAITKKSVIRRYSIALEQMLLDQFCRLRGSCATIPDLVDGRMPLAYAHFVQILVDAFLFVAPLAQYKEIGSFSVVLVGILTVFYRGLLDLAKVFLDPLDSEDFCEGAVYMNIGVLIREVNAATTRWMIGGEKL